MAPTALLAGCSCGAQLLRKQGLLTGLCLKVGTTHLIGALVFVAGPYVLAKAGLAGLQWPQHALLGSADGIVGRFGQRLGFAVVLHHFGLQPPPSR